MSYMKTFAPTSSASFTSKSPHQAVSSSTISSPRTPSIPELEMDANKLGYPSLPQVPTNTPSGISHYDFLETPNPAGDGWNKDSTLLHMNPETDNLQTFHPSCFFPVHTPTLTENFRLFDAGGSQAFYPPIGNNGIAGLGDAANRDLSSAEEAVADRNRNPNRGCGTTDDYSASFY
ncbi:hypothetical protein DSL72_003976 [Monilinia vaccinii-corymbosi]|uniref:Uncharacterized protein n=1 Tax=Monilinia vaccinii-corymbosi TaxID=61207 RepID=A0A8A3NY54_9HELO|nr:hypothetical protein DSL72_003976 [Monilinia vaccinii-corymbosi]